MPPGAIVGIIGPNGAGKSTLFKMITGAGKAGQGRSRASARPCKLAYVDQSRDALEGNKNVWQEVSGGSDILTIGKVEIQSRAYIGRFNFKGQDQQKLVGTLSGGERGRLHLAKTLLQGGNVLLLDEPSNDLDIETLRALEDAMLEFPGCVMVISHDRWFLDRIATHILAFEGDSHVEFFQGNYREYEEDKKSSPGRGRRAAASPALQGAEVSTAHPSWSAPIEFHAGIARSLGRGPTTLVCVGLDPEPAKFPAAPARSSPTRCSSSAAPSSMPPPQYACCFKPQIAHFAALGAEDALQRADRPHPRRRIRASR